MLLLLFHFIYLKSPATEEFIKLLNEYRATKGSGPLKEDETLNKLAQDQADHQKNIKDCSHTGPPGKEIILDRFKQIGYKYENVSENCAQNYDVDAASALEDWKRSKGHNKNMLTRSFTETGVGYAADTDGKVYWTNTFGGPGKLFGPGGAGDPNLDENGSAPGGPGGLGSPSPPGGPPGGGPGDSPGGPPGGGPGDSPGGPGGPGDSPGGPPGGPPGGLPSGPPGVPGSFPGSPPGGVPGSFPGSFPGSPPGGPPGSFPGSPPGGPPDGPGGPGSFPGLPDSSGDSSGGPPSSPPIGAPGGPPGGPPGGAPGGPSSGPPGGDSKGKPFFPSTPGGPTFVGLPKEPGAIAVSTIQTPQGPIDVEQIPNAPTKIPIKGPQGGMIVRNEKGELTIYHSNSSIPGGTGGGAPGGMPPKH